MISITRNHYYYSDHIASFVTEAVRKKKKVLDARVRVCTTEPNKYYAATSALHSSSTAHKPPLVFILSALMASKAAQKRVRHVFSAN